MLVEAVGAHPTKVADLSRAEAILNSSPPFPALRPLSVTAVWAAIKISPKSMAPGRDGLSYRTISWWHYAMV